MEERLIYFGGARGAGKTMACESLGLEAVVGFCAGPPRPIDRCPWAATHAVEGDPIWPGEWTTDHQARKRNNGDRESYRSRFGVPQDARLVRISGDGWEGFTRGMDRSGALSVLRDAQAWCLDRYDVVVHDMEPQEPIASGERANLLIASPETVAWRASAGCWGGRAPFTYEEFAEIARAASWAPASRYYWDTWRWVPWEEWIKEEICRLAPWYHYAVLGGVEVGPAHGLNGIGKWKALRPLLPESLDGLRVLDIGANAGFHSWHCAAEGADVVAVEPDPRFREQLDLVRRFGPLSWDVTSQVTVHDKPIQLGLPKGEFDVVIMSAVHYHINRGAMPYRAKLRDYLCNAPLTDALAVVLEDLLPVTGQLLVVTNDDHWLRVDSPYDEANPQWILNTLQNNFRWTSCRIHDGFGRSHIVTCRGRAQWEIFGEGLPPVPPGPEKITLMLGWRCNSDCVQCWQAASRKAAKLPKISLSFEDARAVLLRYADTMRDLELCSFGEPTLWLGWDALVDLLYDTRFSWRNVNLITNGSLANRYVGVCRLPGSLTVSLDSPHPASYEQIRRGMRFSNVMAGLGLAVQSKGAGRRIGINMTVMGRNKLDVLAMAELAANLKLDYLSILRAENLMMTEAANEELPANDEDVISQIAKARELLSGLEVNDYFTPSAPIPSDGFCRLPWTAMDLDPSGKAHPCCRTYDVDLPGSNPWMSETMGTLRRQLATDTLDPKVYANCAICPYRYKT